MTRTFVSSSAIMLISFSLTFYDYTGAQEAVPTSEPPADASIVSVPAAETPQTPPAWMYERHTQNQQVGVTNVHRDLTEPEAGRYVREHLVNKPRGEMTQTWERTNTDEGYLYRRSQTLTGPDGAPLRQHEWSVSGTDPYNYTREHSITLPDRRTIDQTQVRSWDGTNRTMERTSVGPNGQIRETQRSWNPYGQIGEQTPSMTERVQPPVALPETTPPTSDPEKKVSWWQKLNPFRKTGGETARAASEAPPRRGFTIGTPSAQSAGASSFRSGERPSVQASESTRRPSWAGGAPRSMHTQGPPLDSPWPSTASRPNPGRGHNR